jgi:hypothetical protein
MPAYEVEIPNVGKFRVDSDKELTGEQAYQFALQQAQAPKTDYGYGRAALQGLTFGFADELEARARSLAGEGRYEDILADIARSKKQFEEQSPLGSMAAEIVGGIPTMLAGGAGAAQLASRVPQLASRLSARATGYGGAAATGGVSGAISGAGTAQPDERLAGAATGAGLGVALGPTGELASRITGQAVRRGVQTGAQLIGRDTAETFQRRADEKLIQALQRDGLNPNQVLEKLKTIQRSGYKPETIVEAAGENTRRLADVVAQYPGAAQIAGQLVEERGAGQAGRVISDFQRALNFGGSALDLADDIVKTRSAVAAPLYRQAFSEGGVIQNKRITELMEYPQFQDAYQKARRIAALEGVNLPASAADIEKVGGFDLRTLDYVKRGLDDVLFTSKQPGSGIGRTELGLLKERRTEFVNVLDQVGPKSYKQARQVFAGQTEILNALENGQNFTRLSPDELKRSFSSLSDAEKDAFRAGVFDSVKENINKGADGADALRRVWSSPQKRDQLRIIVGDKNWGDLQNSLAREKIIRQTDVKISGGSQTMPRQLAQREFEGTDELIPLVQQKGIIGGGTDYLLRSLTGPGQPTAQALAPTLFSTNFQNQLQELTRLQQLDQLLRRSAAVRGGAVGTAAGTQTGLLGE